MKYNVYTIRDVFNGFCSPMCDFNDQTAVRNFRAAFRTATSVDPRDYDLFRVASFDTDTGLLIPEASPVLILHGVDVVKEVACE